MKRLKMVFFRNSEKGGAAVEYVIISLFGLVLAGTAVEFVTKTVKAKLAAIEEKLGVEIDDDDWDTW